LNCTPGYRPGVSSTSPPVYRFTGLPVYPSVYLSISSSSFSLKVASGSAAFGSFPAM
jgi:hypothetical protein